MAWLVAGGLFDSLLMLGGGEEKVVDIRALVSPDGYGYAAYQPLAGQPQHNQHRVATSH